jgi:predicted transcriptional regulator
MTILKSGKSVLMAAGTGFGLMQSLRILANIGANVGQNAARMRKIDARVDTLDMAVSRLSEQILQLQVTVAQQVTRDEMQNQLNERLDRVFQQVDCVVEERFDRQAKSVEALRLMVGQTDELLQMVLDRLEALQHSADGRPALQKVAGENAYSTV